MAGKRERLKESVVKTLFALSRNTCAFRDIDFNRGCEERLTDPAWPKVKGEIAHIHGALPGSARFDPDYQRVNDFENLLILCPNHHAHVDDLEPQRYTVEVLRQMKEDHEHRSERASGWANNPRLDEYAAQLTRDTLSRLTAEAIVAEQENFRQALASTINEMSDKKRLVLTLQYYEGLTTAEIASVLGIDPRTVRRIREESLNELRTKLDLAPGWEPHIG